MAEDKDDVLIDPFWEQQSLASEAMFDVVIETKDGDLNEKGVS